MKPTARAVILVAVVSYCTAFAAGIYVDPCGGVNSFPEDGLGLGSSGVIVCDVPGGSSTSAGTGRAGRNYFESHISPVTDVGTIPGNIVSFTHTVTLHPSWDPGVAFVPTELTLDGVVTLFDNDAFVTFMETGVLGGPPLTISLVVGPRFNCPCGIGVNERRVGNQATANTSVQTLIVTISGRANYVALGSPTFDGAVPEPGSWMLMATGLLALIGVPSRRWLRPT